MSTPTPHRSEARARFNWNGGLRVLGYLALIGTGLSYWCARAAYAESERAVLRVGERLSAELGAALLGPPQAVQLNGQRLFVASQQSELSVQQVLEHFDAACAARESPRAQFAEPAQHAQPAQLPERWRALIEDPARFAMMRGESESAGQLACIAPPRGRHGLSALVEGVRAFAESGDLAALGELRYVTARKLATGRTHVLAIWSEGEFRLGALLPSTGDAPGSDMSQVARPPDTRRTLCAMAPGRSYGLRLYDSSRPPREVLAFYDRELPKAGWEPLPLMLPRGELHPGVFARGFTRDGHALAIGVDGSAGATAISVIDLGAVHHVQADAASALE